MAAVGGEYLPCVRGSNLRRRTRAFGGPRSARIPARVDRTASDPEFGWRRLSKLRRLVSDLPDRYRPLTPGLGVGSRKVGMGKPQARESLWLGTRRAPQFRDLCRRGGASRGR